MSTTPKALSGARRYILRVALFLAMLVGGLSLAEFMLSGWHYGRPTGFLEPIHGRGAQRYRENVHFHRAYQTGLWPVPEDTYIDLVMPKPPGIYRIFLFGGSAAMGFPPDTASSLPRMLEVHLEAAFDGIRFEVHNAAFPGMNSHAIREAARECADYAPDLFIVHAGLEEVYGAYGIHATMDGRFDGPAWVPWRVWLKRRQLTQLAAQLRGVDGVPSGHAPIVAELPAPGEAAWAQMAHVLETNLAAVVRAAAGAGAGLLLTTVPFEAATEAMPDYARVLTAAHAAVRRVAAEYEGAALVELAALFDGAAPAGTHFYDGLHPRATATHRMAQALAAEIGMRMGREFLPEKQISLESAKTALGITPGVEQMQLVTMRRAVAEFGAALGMDPAVVTAGLDAEIAGFNLELGHAADTAVDPLQGVLHHRPGDYYLHRQRAAALHAAGDTASALEVIDGLIQRYPGRASLHGDRADYLRGEGDYTKALQSLREGLAADRWNARVYALLGMTLLDWQPGEAAPSFVRGLTLLPGGPAIPGSVDALRERLEAGLAKARQAAQDGP